MNEDQHPDTAQPTRGRFKLFLPRAWRIVRRFKLLETLATVVTLFVIHGRMFPPIAPHATEPQPHATPAQPAYLTSYARACERCKARDVDNGWKWFLRALAETSGDDEKKRLLNKAVNDPDLEPLWPSIYKHYMHLLGK